VGGTGASIPVVIMGLGHIGKAIARAALGRRGLTVVGAVDRDPTLAGRPLADVLDSPAPELRVSADLAGALAGQKGGVVLHATGSRLEQVLPEIQAIVRAGWHAVSTCEELAFPALDHAEEAKALDALCEERSVAVVGTGVNPGFVLDRLPAMLAQTVGDVRHVHAVRVVDVSRRRAALQGKVGVGLTPEAFDAAADRGEIGHVGLSQSAALVAESCLGLEEYEVDEELEPLVAEEDEDGPPPVAAGQVAGVHQTARVFSEEREVVRLEVVLAAHAERPRDEITIDAEARLHVTVAGGLPGDLATAHTVVNAVPAVVERHGLLTVLDLPAGR
jgi:4-hydroxy-tetrahydrodipicolinate reductase